MSTQLDASAVEEEDDESEDASMPELGCEVSVEDLCCDADDEEQQQQLGGGGGCGQQQQRRAEPRRLTLQQRRRLNLYSRPTGVPPKAAAAVTVALPAATADTVNLEAAWTNHDTPTIHEEDSGQGGSVTSPEPLAADPVESPPPVAPATAAAAEFPGGWRQHQQQQLTANRRRRVRTVSEPLSSADAKAEKAAGSADDADEVAAAVAGAADAGVSVNGGNGVRRRGRTQSTSQAGSSPGGSRWPRAFRLAFQTLKNDAWRHKPVSKAPEEAAVRHQYNPHRRQWVQDRVRVKLEPEPFDQGAMRQCYRLKKLPTSTAAGRADNWHAATCNYVAKKYIEEVDHSVYFEDVRLQMNAKLWAQEYNRHQPPKKVDIMQMCVIEFVNRPEAPLYHLEHYIEGDYVKHNSNSGFVDDTGSRQTPHALSHFTFERSGHQLIVVDIQGVDDIYTDPQIHTASGAEYGDGNLGVRGMALFFQSHVCNDICSGMGLSQFDLAPSEIAATPSPSQTMGEETCVRDDIFTVGNGCSPPTSPVAAACAAATFEDSGCSGSSSSSDADGNGNGDDDVDDDSSCAGGGGGGSGSGSCSSSSRGGARQKTWSAPLRRRRNTSGELTPEEEIVALSVALKRRQRPSCAQGVLAGRHQCVPNGRGGSSRSRSDSGGSDCSGGAGAAGLPAGCLPGMPEVRATGPVLGRVHHELARLHESGRFAPDSVDWPAAVYHERLAAELGVVEAAANLARLHLRLPADCLQEVPLDVLQPDPTTGLSYLESAAKLGDRSAMLHLAQANDLGHAGLPALDWYRAAHYYQQALAMSGQADREGGYDSLDTPSYGLRARLAELYLAGGHGLDADPAASVDLYGEAAEDAMAQGNGKLAAKYYQLAEEAAALVVSDGE